MYYVSKLFYEVGGKRIDLSTQESLAKFFDGLKISVADLPYALPALIGAWQKNRTLQGLCDILQGLADMDKFVYVVVVDTTDLSAEEEQLGMNVRWLFSRGIMGFDTIAYDISVFNEVEYIQTRKNLLNVGDTIKIKDGNSGDKLLVSMASTDKTIRVPFGVESILDRAFEKCTKAKGFYVPYTVKGHYSIKNSGGRGSTHTLRFNACDDRHYKYTPNAFGRVTRAFTVYFDDFITAIPSYFLMGAYRLANIHLPYALEELRSYCFAFCRELCSIDFTTTPKLREIGSNAFFGCESLSTVVIPESVEEVSSCAFSCCKHLTNVTLPNEVVLRDGVFAYCISLKEINLPKTMIHLVSNMFTHCFSLEHIDLPTNLKSIGSCAFQQCVGLREITLPDSLTSIYSFAFAECTLEELTIPKGVKLIESNAFCRCPHLKKVVFADRDEYISTAYRGWFASSIIEQLILEPESKVTLNSTIFGGSAMINTLVLKSENQSFDDCEAGLKRVQKIYCYKGTLTEAALKRYGVSYEYLNR